MYKRQALQPIDCIDGLQSISMRTYENKAICGDHGRGFNAVSTRKVHPKLLPIVRVHCVEFSIARGDKNGSVGSYSWSRSDVTTGQKLPLLLPVFAGEGVKMLVV